MSTTIEELTRWMTAPRETENLEFKEAKNQYDNTKLFRHCVALANEGGGKLILGVTDKPPRQVIGTAAFHTPSGIQSKLLDKLRFRVMVEEFRHPDGRVVIFHVPSRPKGTAYELDGAYWMRSPDGTVPMTEDRLRVIFDEGKPDWLMGAARESCSASDVVRLLDTQSYFDLLRLPYPTTRDGVLERFENEKLIIAEGDAYSITNLGEFYQLPAPDFRLGERHTLAVMFAYRTFEQMDGKDRVRACFQHSVLRWMTNQKMTNTSLRERFKLPENKSETVSRIIADAIQQGKIKPDDPSNTSRRYARYVPWWA